MFLPYSFLYSSASNLADIKDVTQDEQDGIETIAVKFGVNNSLVVSAVLASAAVATLSVTSWGDLVASSVAAGIIVYTSVPA